ncbi:MAG: hypothetical protein OEX83_06040 [Gammaproteobacteria bacterium]|nr:hypothetical protein [Gammaproteobacteria bacterium]
MKISQSLASIYQAQFPGQKRDSSSVTGASNPPRTEQEKVIAGEVLRKQPPPTNEIYNKSRVFQQTLFRQESLTGPSSSRQAINSYESHTDIRQENKTGEFIDLFA